MIKWIGIQKRPPNMTADEYRKWYLEKHVNTGRKLPGVRKYVVNLAIKTTDEEPPYDGVAELWFDSMDDVKKGFNSPVMEEAKKDLTENNITSTRIFAEEHIIISP